DQKSIAETVAASGNHTILLAAITEAQVADKLGAKGAYTFFAPTDAAFKKLGDAAVQKLLTDRRLLLELLQTHLVVDKVYLADELKTLDGINGFKIDAKDGIK